MRVFLSLPVEVILYVEVIAKMRGGGVRGIPRPLAGIFFGQCQLIGKVSAGCGGIGRWSDRVGHSPQIVCVNVRQIIRVLVRGR